MKKRTVIFTFLLLIFALCACSSENHGFVIPDAGIAGGYEIVSNGVEIVVYTTGDCKYVQMQTKDGSALRYYITPTEMLIVDKNAKETTYYRETLEASDLKYANPLNRIFGSLDGMDFEETAEGSGIYRASVTAKNQVSKTVGYNLYTIQMTWTDGKAYTYQYFDYADGEFIISVDAPDEINPLLNTDTKWVVDIDNCKVTNSETKEKVSFTVVSVETGEGISPGISETETVTKDYVIEVLMGSNNEIASVRYIAHNMDLTVGILNQYEIVKPEIPAAAREMTAQEVQDAILRAYAAESLI